jgi:hypothetical protein
MLISKTIQNQFSPPVCLINPLLLLHVGLVVFPRRDVLDREIPKGLQVVITLSGAQPVQTFRQVL